MLLISSAFAASFFDEISTSAYVATSLANVRAAPEADAPVVGRLVGATRVDVLAVSGDRVQVRTPLVEGWMPRTLLTPVGGRFDLDGDGEIERIALRAGGGQVRMWMARGETAEVVTLHNTEAYNYGSLKLHEEGGRRMLRVELGVDACADYPVTWFVLDGGLREVLRVVDWADGEYGGENDVTFRGADALVRYIERGEDGAIVARKSSVCPWDGQRFGCPAE